MEIISSPQNSMYKKIKSLAAKKNRDETGLFIIEGAKFVKDIAGQTPIMMCAVSASYYQKNAGTQYPAELAVFSDALFAKLSDTVTAQGILAICEKPEYDIDNTLGENALVILLDGLQDPGNIGTIIRTAAAAGATGVIVSKNSADIYSPKVLRSTASAILRIPVISEVDMVGAIKRLKSKNINVYASRTDASSSLYSLNLKESSAFIIGNEARGISEEAEQLCGKAFKIPMAYGVDSLNASVACALMIYEALRQRLYH